MADCSVKESLRLIEDLKFFLATAPANWQENQVIRRYYLNSDEGFVSCVFWNNLYFVTGTDIVRCIVYKFEHFGRKIVDRKKFEEGIFSDLRNLKCGTDAILEPPRSDFLEFLFKNSCLRTQKKQKVFFWFNVPHDKLMADALERDLKKESQDQNPTTIAYREPAISFKYDDKAPLFTQLVEHMEKQQKLNNSIRDDIPNQIEAVEEHIKDEEDQLSQVHAHGHEDNENARSDISRNLKPSKSSIKNFNNRNLPQATKVPTNNRKINIITESIGEKEEDKNYEFLNQETPVQYKNGADYEDDFPLDYFEGQNAPNEYFNVDVGGVNANATGVEGIEEQYDSYIDPSVFSAPTTSNPLVFNDEYLIEQTQPLKSAKYPAASFSQTLANSRLLSSNDDYFPSPPQPLSAKYQQQFQRGQQLQFQQQILQQQQLQLQQQSSQQQVPAQFWNEAVLPQQYYASESGYLPIQQVEGEYWQHNDHHVQLQQQPSYVQVQQSHPMMGNGAYYITSENEVYNPVYQGVNSSMVLHHPIGSATPGVVGSGGISAANAGSEYALNRSANARQQPINNNILLKKRQLHQSQPVQSSSRSSSGGYVSKPEVSRRPNQSYGNLDEIVAHKNTKVANKREDDATESQDSQSQQQSSTTSKKSSFIPTPESSVNQAEHHGSHSVQGSS